MPKKISWDQNEYSHVNIVTRYKLYDFPSDAL